MRCIDAWMVLVAYIVLTVWFLAVHTKVTVDMFSVCLMLLVFICLFHFVMCFVFTDCPVLYSVLLLY